MAPRVVLIGAGKTMASRELLTSVLKIPVFTNADAITRGLNSLDPESEAFQANTFPKTMFDVGTFGV